MKKSIALFLCCLVMFNATVRPALAMEEATPVTYSTAASVVVSSAGSGTFLAGATSLAGPVSVLLLAIIASGVYFYGVDQMAVDAVLLYNKLSTAIQNELSDIFDTVSPGDTFHFSQNALDEINAIVGDYYFTDDGSFAGGLTLDASSLITYDFSRDFIYGEGTPSAVYQYNVSSSFTQMGSSGLSIRYVTNPAGLQIHNSVNGVTLTIYSGQVVDSIQKLIDGEILSLTASMPFIESSVKSKYHDISYHEMGIWLLETVSEGYYVASRAMDSLGYEFVLNGSSLASSGSICSDAFVTDTADSFSVTYQHDEVINGKTSTDALDFPFEHVMSWPKTRSAAGHSPISASDTIVMPTSLEWESADVLNPSKVNEDFADVETPSVDVSGFWASLWEWLQRIIDAIANIGTIIRDAFATLKDLIVDVLETVFVPDLSELGDVVDVYSNKFGWVSDLYLFVKDILNSLRCDVPPKIPIDLGDAESPNGYNYGGETYVLDMTWYARYKDTVDFMLSGILWLFFIWRMFKRIPDILAGVGIETEYASLERGWTHMKGGKSK